MVARDRVGLGLTGLRREVVARLRERSAGLRDAVAPLIDEFDRLLGSGETLEVSNVDRLRRGHETLLDALAERYDALEASLGGVASLLSAALRQSPAAARAEPMRGSHSRLRDSDRV
jgi:hypothetical protein